MSDPKGQIAVIREQKQALRLLVQTSDMSKIRQIFGEQIVDCFSGSFVGSSGQKSAGLFSRR